MPFCKVDEICISSDASLRRAMEVINQTVRGIVVVTDSAGLIEGTLTDGDIRRAILQGVSLEVSVRQVLTGKRGPPPVTAPAGLEPTRLLALLREHHVRQLPLLDATGRVIDLVTIEDLLPADDLGLQAVIMAGGAGSRLRPLTEDTPKPMLPVGGRPLMELILERLREVGIKTVTVATHYRGDKIVEHFGSGEGFGVAMRYVAEDKPLGTAGALGLLEPPSETLLVINGDILTDIDFRAMVRYHREHQAALTLATRQYDLNIPYGVVEREGLSVRKLIEKPSISISVNAGIYLLEPQIHRFIPGQQALEMTELIQRLLDAQQRVLSFPVFEYWLDIGQPSDYVRAQDHVKRHRTSA